MEPRSHGAHSVRSRGWDDVVTIHWRDRSMAISMKPWLFLSFFVFFNHLSYFLSVKLDNFIFHAVTKYEGAFPGHVGFLIWKKTHSSLSESQETLRIRLLNTIKLIVHMLMVSNNDEWFCCKFRMRSCYHDCKIQFLIGKTLDHPTSTLWFDLLSHLRNMITSSCIIQYKFR